MADQEDDRVGYRRPPKHSRFKPGQSGNPKGRRKGARGLKADLLEALNAQQTILINKQPVTDRRQSLALKTLTTRAAAGDIRAIKLLVDLIIQVCGVEEAGSGRSNLSAQDEAILEQLLSRKIDDDQALGSTDEGTSGDV
jgi:hypothetical protein